MAWQWWINGKFVVRRLERSIREAGPSLTYRFGAGEKAATTSLRPEAAWLQGPGSRTRSARTDLPEALGPLGIGVVPAVAGSRRGPRIGRGGGRAHEADRRPGGDGAAWAPP